MKSYTLKQKNEQNEMGTKLIKYNKLLNYLHQQKASVQYCISSNYNAIYTF